MIAPAETISHLPKQTDKSSSPKSGVRLYFITYTLFAVSLATASMLIVYSAVFFTFGLVLATFPIAIALTIPAINVIDRRREMIGFALFLALSLGTPIIFGRLGSFLPAMQLLLLNASVIVCMLSLSRLLWCWLDRSLVMTLVLILAIGWFAFPVWASHLMLGHASDRWLVWILNVHPVIGINASYLSLGEWAHQNISYWYLTNLGQDVSYSLPFGQAAAAILFHMVPAILLMSIPVKKRPRV